MASYVLMCREETTRCHWLCNCCSLYSLC